MRRRSVDLPHMSAVGGLAEDMYGSFTGLNTRLVSDPPSHDSSLNNSHEPGYLAAAVAEGG